MTGVLPAPDDEANHDEKVRAVYDGINKVLMSTGASVSAGFEALLLVVAIGCLKVHTLDRSSAIEAGRAFGPLVAGVVEALWGGDAHNQIISARGKKH